MKTQLLPLFALFLFIFSCKDVEEVSPNIQISGVYESTRGTTLWGGETKYDLVDKLMINADGTFAVESITLSSGTDEILGYRAIYSGTYTIADQKVTITYEDPLVMNMMDIYYMPKADLTLMEGESFNAEFTIAEDYSQLSPICPPNANCTTPIPYIKID